MPLGNVSHDPLLLQVGNEATQSSSPSAGGELGCSQPHLSILHHAKETRPSNQTLWIFLGASSRDPACPNTYYEHRRASASVTKEQDMLQVPAVPPANFLSWHRCRTQHLRPPSSHQPRSLARQRKTSVGWEGAGEIHRDVLQGKHG